MKMKFMALTLSAVMIANPLAVFADEADSQLVDLSKLDPAITKQIAPEVLKALGASAQKKTIEDLRATLASVDAMIGQLDSLQNKAGDDTFLKVVRIFQGAFLGFNAYAVKLHMKDKAASDIVAYLTVASAVLNTMSRHYNPTTHSFDFINNQGRIEPKTVVQVIDESTKEIASRPGLPPDVTEAIQTLGQLKGNVELQRNHFTEMVENQGGFFQDASTGLSAISILMHLVSPKLAKYADKLMAEAQPVIQAAKKDGSFAALTASTPKVAKYGAAIMSTTVKGTEQAKRGGSLSALTADLPDLYSMVFGYSSTGAQNIILKTMMDLNKTKFNLESTIRCRSTKVEQGQDAAECSKG